MISTFGWIIILFFLLFMAILKDAWNLKKKQKQEEECRKINKFKNCQECTKDNCIYQIPVKQ